ncbi:MAG: 3-dehydroquinate synthase [Pirellulales bacterium]|nr:3-dehydroquinate synthase [Pirellulales bacterium]
MVVNSTSSTVHVNLGPRSYDIRIGTGNLHELGGWISASGGPSHAVVISDTNIDQTHAEVAVKSLQDAGWQVEVLVTDPGERTKSVKTAWLLWDKLLELNVNRQTAVVAVGGGVVGDLAGFVAATYGRGLPFWQVPTTLLAQVDSSVGGKVGVNLAGGKNMVGCFWQPRGVLIDTTVLNTLPPREYRAGLAEVVKYGVILDPEFFVYLEQHIPGIKNRDPSVLEHIVARCCRLKADVVEQDEREETGHRAVLNYGHTFCHAFETLTRYAQLLHGEAVSIGMTCAAQLAERLGRIDAALVKRQERLLRALSLPTYVPRLNADKVISVMRRDKKATAGHLRLVLPTRLGHVELVDDVPVREIRAVLNAGRPDLQRAQKQAGPGEAAPPGPAASPGSEAPRAATVDGETADAPSKGSQPFEEAVADASNAMPAESISLGPISTNPEEALVAPAEPPAAGEPGETSDN